jgi:hypothetical protein
MPVASSLATRGSTVVGVVHGAVVVSFGGGGDDKADGTGIAIGRLVWQLLQWMTSSHNA